MVWRSILWVFLIISLLSTTFCSSSAKPKPTLYSAMCRYWHMWTYTCLAAKKHRFGPKQISEAISDDLFFSWPSDPSSYCVLMYTLNSNLTASNLMANTTASCMCIQPLCCRNRASYQYCHMGRSHSTGQVAGGSIDNTGGTVITANYTLFLPLFLCALVVYIAAFAQCVLC